MTRENTITGGRGVARLIIESPTEKSGIVARQFKKYDYLNISESAIWQYFHIPYTSKTVMEVNEEMIEEKKERLRKVIWYENE